MEQEAHNSQEDPSNPKELFEYLINIEHKDSQTYVEILNSLTLTPSPIDFPETNLTSTFAKHLKKCMNFDINALIPSDLKSQMENLCNLGFVEIMSSGGSESTILELIQLYLLSSRH